MKIWCTRRRLRSQVVIGFMLQSLHQQWVAGGCKGYEKPPTDTLGSQWVIM